MSYYGVDWLATSFALLATYLLGNGEAKGFKAFIVANICWVVVGTMASSPAIVLGNLSFLAINVRGWMRWKHKEVIA